MSWMEGLWKMSKLKTCGIYKITSPKKSVYIGQSINIESRFTAYRRLNCNRQPKLEGSFKKYGIDKHKFEIIHECKQEELNDLEKYYVDLYQCFNSKYGLNLKDGGNARGKSSLETRKK